MAEERKRINTTVASGDLNKPQATNGGGVEETPGPGGIPVYKPTAAKQAAEDANAYSGLNTLITNYQNAQKENADETEAQRKKRERLERNRALISALGDGISALGNLYFTTKGAPNVPQDATLSKAASKFRDDAMAAREARRGRKERFAELEAKIRQQKADLQYNRGQQAIANKRAEEELAIRRAIADAQAVEDKLANDLAQGKIDEQKYNTEIAKAKAEYIKKNGSLRGWSSNPNGSGGNRAPGEYPWYDSNGGLHYAHSYEAARQNAKQNGTWKDEVNNSTSTKSTIVGDETTTTTKQGRGHSVKPGSNGGGRISPTVNKGKGGKKSPTA